jgi:Holliday junction DNA helicase RuvA
MLAYIKGTLEEKKKDYVVIDVGGLGYKVFMPETSIENIGELGDKVKVHTYYKVREDDISIFGFNTAEELRLFELLISVSGVGAKTAVVMLSTIKPSEFAMAVISNDITKLVKIPGVGKKSAQRIVLELKDKLNKEEGLGQIESAKIKEEIQENTNVNEAVSALRVLGFSVKEIESAFEKIDKQEKTVEDLIKSGLKVLSK